MTGNKKRVYQILISFIFIIALLYLVSKVNFNLVYQGLVGANKFYLLLGVLSLLLAAFIKIIRLTLVTRYFNYPLSYLEASLIQMVGISIAILTPARVGEGSKAVLLNKRAGVPLSNAIRIVIFERFFDMIFLGAGAFLFAYYILPINIASVLGVLVGILVISFIIFLRYFNALRELIPSRIRPYFTDVTFDGGLLLGTAVFITTGLTWLFEAGLPWLLAQSMNVTISFPLVFGVVCISTMAVIISILPAGIGTMDLSFLVLFPLIGGETETALSILLIYRLFGILLPFLFSLIIVNYYGTSFSEIKKKIKG
jgi:uncharacterized membrane protein YbhN (UPF0104 family)